MTTTGVRVDGRTARRERNVTAVLEAMQGLIVEGHVNPAPELVAARSGVSPRSVYRYFPDREQLVMASLAHQLGFAELVFYIDQVGEGSRSDRVERFVQHRLAVHDVMGPTARVALVTAQEMPVLAEAIRARQVQLRDLVAEHFAPDLGHLEPSARENCEEALDVLCQFESIETLSQTRGLAVERVYATLTSAVDAMLAAADITSDF